MTDASGEAINPDQPAYGRCPDNPSNDTHAFIDMGERFGALRWRCEFCNQSQVELSERIASLN